MSKQLQRVSSFDDKVDQMMIQIKQENDDT